MLDSQVYSIRETREELSRLVELASLTGRRFLITKFGKPKAAIVPVPKDLLKRREAQITEIMEIATSIEIPMSQLALAWVLRRPEITSTIMGASKPEQVIENAAASNVTLSDETLAQIEKTLDNKPTTSFRQWG